MKTTICFLLFFFFFSLLTPAQSPAKMEKTVHVDSFYIDETEIKSGEPYKTYLIPETKNKIKKAKIGSSLSLLKNKYWTTCAFFDSLNQYSKIQLVNKTKLSGGSNCTNDAGAKSEWLFSETGKEKTLTIKMQTGWELKDEMLTQLTTKWRWKYDLKSNNIYIYKLQTQNIYAPNPENAVFCFSIKEISNDNVIFAVLKL